MSIQASDEFKGFCVGLDVALTRERANSANLEEAENRLDSAIRESMSYFDITGLEQLRTFLAGILSGKDAATELEALWLSTKPTKMFFGRSKTGDQEPAYVFIFRRTLKLLEDEIASRQP
ncbi:hypothetical protein ACNHKD_17145 [Methylocystis sp. JAN1]|jgi:hypothetical protein|uniref:hypothetical protein n=1 Tax=Methylocystis sp. JAN1 TaxID=3397211 RepID=UPI003FA2D9F2